MNDINITVDITICNGMLELTYRQKVQAGNLLRELKIEMNEAADISDEITSSCFASVSEFEDYYQNANPIFIVATAGHKIIGLCELEIVDVDVNEIVIYNLIVVEEHRSHGVGSELLNTVKETYEDYTIRLSTPLENEAVIAFYHRNGFVDEDVWENETYSAQRMVYSPIEIGDTVMWLPEGDIVENSTYCDGLVRDTIKKIIEDFGTNNVSSTKEQIVTFTNDLSSYFQYGLEDYKPASDAYSDEKVSAMLDDAGFGNHLKKPEIIKLINNQKLRVQNKFEEGMLQGL